MKRKPAPQIEKPAKVAPESRASKGKGSKFVEALLGAYDPEKDLRIKQAPNHAQNFLEGVKAGQEGHTVDRATILEVNGFGGYRTRVVEGTAEFKKVMESASSEKTTKRVRAMVEAGIKLRPEKSFTESEKKDLSELLKSNAKLRESFTNAESGDDRNSPFNEFIPIMGGPFSKQLYLHDFLDMQAKAFEAWNHNPIAHQIVKINSYFTLGRGVGFQAATPLVQDLFAKWFSAQEMEERLEHWSDMLSRDGELMIRFFVNPITQSLFLRWVDPSTIWEIVTDLEDIERVYYYHQQYPTAYQVLYGAGSDKKFNPTNFGSSSYVINQIPADEMLHVKINCSPNEKRGRTDFFPILGWLKRYKDFGNAVVLRAVAIASFCYKIILKGADADVQGFLNEFGDDPPEFGSVWIENEASTLEAMPAVSGGQGGNLEDAPIILNMIAVGAGIPKEYLGLSDHSTRSTAVVASEPGVKRFQSRQILLGRVLKNISKRWFNQEVAANRIPKLMPADADDFGLVSRFLQKQAAAFPFIAPAITAVVKFLSGQILMDPTDYDKHGNLQFHFPEIAIEDRSAKLKDLESVYQAGSLSHKRLSEMSAKELSIEGYDYEEEMEARGKEDKEAAGQLYAVPNSYNLVPEAPIVAPGLQPPSATPATAPEKSAPSRPAPNEPQPPAGQDGGNSQPPKKVGGLSGSERRAIKQNDGH